MISSAEEFDAHSMPVALALMMCFGWMLLCSGLFCLWEREWTYFTAFYFFFVSLFTIGLGEITPNQPKMMIFAFGFVIIGLSLVSMTINVIQQKIEAYLYRMMRRIQEEYRRALEMGEGPERDEILARIMKDQPWFMKKFMPSMMGEKQKEQLENHIADQALITTKLFTNTKAVQTDFFNEDPQQQEKRDHKEAATSPRAPDWLMDKSMEFRPEMMDESISPRPQDWLMDKSMEFCPEMMDHSVSPLSVDWLMDKSTEFSPQMTDQAVSPRAPDWLMDRSVEFCPDMQDADTQMDLKEPESKITQTNQVRLDDANLQTSFVLETEKPETSDNVMQTSNVETEEKNSQVGCGGPQMDQSIQVRHQAEDQESQTDPSAKTEEDCTQTNVETLVITLPAPPIDSSTSLLLSRSGLDNSDNTASQTESSASDVEIQTDDSYLKIARRLNALRTNRTKSLAVLALPKDRHKKAVGVLANDTIAKQNGTKDNPKQERSADPPSYAISPSTSSTSKSAQNGAQKKVYRFAK